MKYLSKLMQFIEDRNKRQTLAHLRVMSDRQMIDCGISPELLKQGVKAWPWRAQPESVAPFQSVGTSNLAEFSISAKSPTKPKLKRSLAQRDAA